MGEGHGGGIDAGTANDKDVVVEGSMAETIVKPAMGESLVKRSVALATRQGAKRRGQHNVAPVGQGSLGKRVEGVAAHYDGMAGSKQAETPHVVGQAIEELVVIAYSTVGGDSGNNSYIHKPFLSLYRHVSLYMRPRVVVLQLEIIVVEVEDALDIGIYHHDRQLARLTRQLQTSLVKMVEIEMGVAGGVDEVAGLESGDLSHHH